VRESKVLKPTVQDPATSQQRGRQEVTRAFDDSLLNVVQSHSPTHWDAWQLWDIFCFVFVSSHNVSESLVIMHQSPKWKSAMESRCFTVGQLLARRLWPLYMGQLTRKSQ